MFLPTEEIDEFSDTLNNNYQHSLTGVNFTTKHEQVDENKIAVKVKRFHDQAVASVPTQRQKPSLNNSNKELQKKANIDFLRNRYAIKHRSSNSGGVSSSQTMNYD